MPQSSTQLEPPQGPSYGPGISKIQILLASASRTQAFQVEEKGPGTLLLHMHAPGDPEKRGVIGYTPHLSSIELHLYTSKIIISLWRPQRMHMQCVLSPFLSLKGLGTRPINLLLLSQSGPAL